ncbi:PREDICTED: C-type natriuretic peptide-like [Condylura cristata]|uniref:C-type natriuretic peptide-like n=1 Tax=Condylura cristata TaxID=143302 RepID=UPI0006439F7B|nr:PREDICTED: C-type natriuretic peptide-like [Condylura cristata]
MEGEGRLSAGGLLLLLQSAPIRHQRPAPNGRVGPVGERLALSRVPFFGQRGRGSALGGPGSGKGATRGGVPANERHQGGARTRPARRARWVLGVPTGDAQGRAGQWARGGGRAGLEAGALGSEPEADRTG